MRLPVNPMSSINEAMLKLLGSCRVEPLIMIVITLLIDARVRIRTAFYTMRV